MDYLWHARAWLYGPGEIFAIFRCYTVGIVSRCVGAGRDARIRFGGVNRGNFTG